MELAQLLPHVWSPERGWNMDMIVNYALVIAFTSPVLLPLLLKLSKWLERQVDKIHFKVPLLGWDVNFSEMTWDNAVFERINVQLQKEVVAKQDEAKKLRLEYTVKVSEALQKGDHAEATKLLEEMRTKLKGLTDDVIKTLPTEVEPELMRALESRLGDKTKVAVYLAKEVKSIVEEVKKGDAEHVSLHKIILEHALKGLGNLGNGPSNGGGSEA